MLIALGVSFAVANVWFAAVRSTIPLRLSAIITQKQRLIEKTIGVDDACLLTLNSGERIQVDGAVFDAMAENKLVNKQAWSRIIDVDGRKISLEWSADFRGMRWAMPLTVAVLIVLGIMGLFPLDVSPNGNIQEGNTSHHETKNQTVPFALVPRVEYGRHKCGVEPQTYPRVSIIRSFIVKQPVAFARMFTCKIEKCG